MGLITMGYGHLTIIPMGLGNSIIRVRRRRLRRPFGDVEFIDVPTGVEVEDISVDIAVKEEVEKIEETNIEEKVSDG